MTRRLILLRHGQTHYNATMRMQGQLDTTLSEQGHKQARLAAEVIAYRHPFALYSSDLQRARKTADAMRKRRVSRSSRHMRTIRPMRRR